MIYHIVSSLNYEQSTPDMGVYRRGPMGSLDVFTSFRAVRFSKSAWIFKTKYQKMFAKNSNIAT